MDELLEELRVELFKKHSQLRDAEDRLAMLVDKAADAIRDVEMEKSKIKTLREEADSLEDAIYRLSS